MSTRACLLTTGDRLIGNVHHDGVLYEFKDPYVFALIPHPSQPRQARLVMKSMEMTMKAVKIPEHAIVYWIDPVPKEVESHWLQVTSGIVPASQMPQQGGGL